MEVAQFFDALAAVPNTRSARFDDLEVSEWSEGFRFEGHAAVFEETADIGDFTEAIERGAFRKVLSQGANVPMLYDHNAGLPILASTGGGTLKLEEDAKGLGVLADVADTQLGRDVRVLAKRGDIRGMSYGFVAGAGNSKVEMRDGKPHRRLLSFKRLLDVSPTWDPAYRSTEAQFRSLTMQYAASPDSLQQLIQGAYPQLGERADESDDRRTEEAQKTPVAPELDEARSGADWQSAARTRARSLLIGSIVLGGDL